MTDPSEGGGRRLEVVERQGKRCCGRAGQASSLRQQELLPTEKTGDNVQTHQSGQNRKEPGKDTVVN